MPQNGVCVTSMLMLPMTYMKHVSPTQLRLVTGRISNQSTAQKKSGASPGARIYILVSTVIYVYFSSPNSSQCMSIIGFFVRL